MDLALALDLGGTQVRAALVARDGTLANRFATPTQNQAGAEVVIGQLVDACHTVSKDLPSGSIVGVGVSSPGPLDTEKGLVIALPNIRGLDMLPLRAELERRLEKRVWLENDGIAAAIGEWRFGAGRGLRSLVYVTVSTGIGGGVIVDGHVMRGRKGMAAHVGHLCIDSRGVRCGCGNTGCWEAYAAGPAFAARARSHARRSIASVLYRDFETLQPADVFRAAQEGDSLASELVAEEARLLGVGITSLLHLFSPETVVIGGGLSNAFDQLFPGIMAYVQDNAIPAFRDVPVVKASLGGDSGLVGAASLAFSG